MRLHSQYKLHHTVMLDCSSMIIDQWQLTRYHVAMVIQYIIAIDVFPVVIGTDL